VINANLEFDRAVKSLETAVDESAWRWTRQILLPFMKSSIDSAARSALQGTPVASHKVLAAHYCEAMHVLQASLNGINSLSLEAKAKEIITKHTLKCMGGLVLDVMVTAAADPVLVSSLNPTRSSMTAEMRSKILQKSSACDETAKLDAANKYNSLILLILLIP
jgi:hypothetical protein